MSLPEENSPEHYYMHLKTESALAEARAQSDHYGGWASLMAGGIWFASGGFVAKCLLEISGKAEHMSAKEQGLVIAAGGLAAALAVIRKGYKGTGIHPLQIVQSRQERQRGDRLNTAADYLRPWLDDSAALPAVDESVIEEFRQEMDREL